jgi:hypothetical protein
MKPLKALFVSLLAGIATFVAQGYFDPPGLRVAASVVRRSTDWGHQILTRASAGNPTIGWLSLPPSWM